MSESIVSKWNARYSNSDTEIPAPAEVLSRGARWLPKGTVEVKNGCVTQRTALDLACGLAGNAHYLANAGFRVSAWDVSDVLIEKLRNRSALGIANIEVRDVVEHPPEPDSFDVIVVSRFLDRQLCSPIARALKPGGVLFYQTFSKGLKNNSYLLAPNELLRLFESLQVLDYQESDAIHIADNVSIESSSDNCNRELRASENQTRSEASLIARRSL